MRHGRPLLVGQSLGAALQVPGECTGRAVRGAGILFCGALQERRRMFEEWTVQLSQWIRRLLLRDCDEHFDDAELQWAQQLFEGARGEGDRVEGEATWGSL